MFPVLNYKLSITHFMALAQRSMMIVALSSRFDPDTAQVIAHFREHLGISSPELWRFLMARGNPKMYGLCHGKSDVFMDDLGN